MEDEAFFGRRNLYSNFRFQERKTFSLLRKFFFARKCIFDLVVLLLTEKDERKTERKTKGRKERIEHRKKKERQKDRKKKERERKKDSKDVGITKDSKMKVHFDAPLTNTYFFPTKD
jgi:hypothetical protein